MASTSKSTSAHLQSNNGIPVKQQQQQSPGLSRASGSGTMANPSKMVRVKSEVTGTAETAFPTERLSSFRLPRDLTLGGMGLSATKLAQRANAANKKVYTPNLNAVRNRNNDVKTSRDTSAGSRGRGGGVGRGRGGAQRGGRERAAGPNSRGSLITSSGLFSEGAGDGVTRRSVSRFRSSNESGESTQLRRPTIIKKEKIDHDVEQSHIRDIYELDSELVDDDKSSNDSFSPINLTEVKRECKLENRINGLEIKAEPDVDVHRTEEYPTSLDEYFQRTNAQMFMLQLPDSLPGHAPIQEPAESAEFERPESPNPTSLFCTMGQLDDGIVGRLVRYRSGKTKLILGDTRFDVSLGMDPGFIQDVLSINTNPGERSGNMINLGHIGAKFNAIPDWEYMLATSTNVTDS